MSKITSAIVVDWIQWLKQQPTAKNVYRKSFIKELKMLQVILNWHKNFVDENFYMPITKKHWRMCFFKDNPPRKPDYYMRPTDVQRWIQWLKNHRKNEVYWQLAIFQLSTGVRVGEACGLRWSEIDLERRTARIVRRVRWDRINKKPFLEDVAKTNGSARLIMLPKGLINILEEMQSFAKSDLVFANTKGDLLKYNAIQGNYNAGFRALRLPWRSTHICRHTYATLSLIAGNSLSAVQASLGHTEQRTTQRYAKVIAALNHGTNERTFSVLFKDNQI